MKKKIFDFVILGTALFSAIVLKDAALAVGGVVIYLLGNLTVKGNNE